MGGGHAISNFLLALHVCRVESLRCLVLLFPGVLVIDNDGDDDVGGDLVVALSSRLYNMIQSLDTTPPPPPPPSHEDSLLKRAIRSCRDIDDNESDDDGTFSGSDIVGSFMLTLDDTFLRG